MPPESSPSVRGPNWTILVLIGALAGLLVAGVGWFRPDPPVAVPADAAILDVRGAPARGSADATLTLVEFSDYECPFCIRHARQTMPKIDAAYIATGKVRYVFKDWPVDQLHPEAMRAHEAGHCATEQGKFWEVHPRLFGAPGTHTPDLLERIATDTGLDIAQFRECTASGRARASINQTIREAASLGATGTPAFFIGIRDPATERMSVLEAISGAQPFDAFSRAIDSLLR